MENAEEIQIVAEMLFQPGARKEAMDALLELGRGSRAEAGNISYEIVEDIHNPDHLFVIETWKSPRAIEEHNVMPHFVAFKKAVEGKLLENRVTLLKKLNGAK